MEAIPSSNFTQVGINKTKLSFTTSSQGFGGYTFLATTGIYQTRSSEIIASPFLQCVIEEWKILVLHANKRIFNR